MNNKEKYNKAFIDSLLIKKDIINDNLAYSSIPEWDSIGHMELMAELEEGFEITLDMDDIIDFSSYTKGLEILRKYPPQNVRKARKIVDDLLFSRKFGNFF